MRILIFHGYLLRGTGSNIYNANLARTLARLGHEVDLFCHDRTAHEPEGVTIRACAPPLRAQVRTRSLSRSWLRVKDARQLCIECILARAGNE